MTEGVRECRRRMQTICWMDSRLRGNDGGGGAGVTEGCAGDHEGRPYMILSMDRGLGGGDTMQIRA